MNEKTVTSYMLGVDPCVEGAERTATEVAMRNKHIIRDDITNIIMMNIFCFEDKPITAFDHNSQRERAIQRYRCDYIFKGRIDSQVELIIMSLFRNGVFGQ